MKREKKNRNRRGLFVLLCIAAFLVSFIGSAIFKISYTSPALAAYYVDWSDADNEDYGKYEVYYPTEISSSGEKYPVIVVVNGTGIPASKYPALLEHFASWGFIVIGNEQEFSWKGDGADACLDYLLSENENSESVFYGKIDAGKAFVSENAEIVNNSLYQDVQCNID